MAGYTRQAAANMVTGLTIFASDLNSEFNALQSAFSGSTGHVHDGTTGNGPKISLTSSVIGTLGIGMGGTNATTAAGARTSLFGVSTTSDNAVARYDGTTGALQNSGVVIDDGANLVTGPGIFVQNVSGANKTLFFQTSGSSRWSVISNAVAESGSNVGSDFQINRYNDSGTFIDASISISRSTGLVNIPQSLVVGGNFNYSGIATGRRFDLNDTVASGNRIITIQTSNSFRWAIAADGSPEVGGNSGSNLVIGRYSDAGSFIDTTFSINRSNGQATFNGPLISNNSITAAFTVSAKILSVSDTVAGGTRYISFNTSGSQRWAEGTNSAPESGSNAGSDWFLNRYSDSGVYLGTPLSISRASGEVNIPVLSTTNLSSTNLFVTGGTISGITDLAVADGGTGASTALAARTNLGVPWELVSDTSFTSQSAVNFTNLSAYRFLKITGILSISSAGAVAFNTSTNNGSSYDTGASDYSYQIFNSTNTVLDSASGTNNGLPLTSALTADVNSTINFETVFYNFNVASSMSTLCRTVFQRSSQISLSNYTGFRLNATARNALRVLGPTNAMTGRIIIEGIR